MVIQREKTRPVWTGKRMGCEIREFDWMSWSRRTVKRDSVSNDDKEEEQ